MSQSTHMRHIVIAIAATISIIANSATAVNMSRKSVTYAGTKACIAAAHAHASDASDASDSLTAQFKIVLDSRD